MKYKIKCLALGLGGLGLALGLVGDAKAISTNPPVSITFGPQGGSLTQAATATAPGKAEPAPPGTPREFFNAGTQQLRAGKLREAEAFLESATASQQEPLQAPALYNLGHVRFAQGIEVLKKSPPKQPTLDRGRAAAQQADAAIRQAEQALLSNDLQKLVAAYMRGRGARKELKAATEAVQRALAVHGAALARWQRASGDFKSVVELQATDADARHNAGVVDQCIAKLVDSVRELQACANGMCDKKGQLGEKLSQLKGRIPDRDAPPGNAGEEDEEEELPFGRRPGEMEGPSKEGDQMTLSQEQAGWVLEGFKLDAERRLPMGQGDVAEPKDRNRPTW
jgi:tetratricopeptide (TPR) repeat protein